MSYEVFNTTSLTSKQPHIDILDEGLEGSRFSELEHLDVRLRQVMLDWWDHDHVTSVAPKVVTVRAKAGQNDGATSVQTRVLGSI